MPVQLVALDDLDGARLAVGDLRHSLDILVARLAAQIDAAIGDDAVEPGRELGAARAANARDGSRS